MTHIPAILEYMTNHSKGTMVVLGTDLAERSLRAAHDAGTSRSELIRRLLADYLALTEEQ